MPLFSERNRAEQYAAREAAGEKLWTEDLPLQARMQIAELWDLFEGMSSSASGFSNRAAQQLRIAGLTRASNLHSDLILQDRDTAFTLDLIECVRYAVTQDYKTRGKVSEFDSILNAFLASHRIAFRMVDGEFIPFSSDELHREVVEPVIRLLVDKRFEKAQAAYLSAIKEIAVDPADAITDAGTALQEALEALGCTGVALGALIKDAKSKGLLGKHDQALTDGIERFLVWAAAIRNNKGDGHHVTDASRSDAWLMIHVVGALILRLANEPTSAAE
ncbi:hypothetical protein [Aeromicrobium yanjiei]|uniref:Abortive infection protein-like C-terminal domain-containing protein n=1 Tax=Aeromicrobium yanjiei TaxID=2662028 RepID=A0A5Q2MM85_9ACTN|nr:hypothetical protein [Aeromicrobium yanjiei]QGG41050.1 hypothetical protein GEV26_06545 [Aeromicrobium yanjiei]